MMGNEITASYIKASAYLAKPYARVFVPDYDTSTGDTNGYTASILEFPGCITEGDTLQEAYDNLHRTAHGWLMAVIETGQRVPIPDIDKPRKSRIGYIQRILDKETPQ